jgi:hypothetical protein
MILEVITLIRINLQIILTLSKLGISRNNRNFGSIQVASFDGLKKEEKKEVSEVLNLIQVILYSAYLLLLYHFFSRI